MFKKLLSLSIALVMLCTAAFIAPETSFISEKASAATATEATASSFEAIHVAEQSAGGVKLSSGYKPGTTALRIDSEYTGSAVNDWLYVKYDITPFKGMNADDIKSVVLGLPLRFSKTGTFYIKSLKEDVYKNAASAVEASGASSVTVDAETAASKFVNPRKDTDTDIKELGSVYKGYNNYTMPAKLTGIKYTFNTLFEGAYKSATIGGGTIDEYVKEAIRNGDDYLYFSLCFYRAHTKETYGYFYCYASSNYITVSTEPKVIYNSVAGNKFNTTVTALNRETDFNYTANIASKDTNVRLLAAIYGEYGALEDIIISDKLSSNNGNLSLTVPLSSYPDATSVTCYIWDGDTLRPYAEPKVTPVKTELQELYSGKKVIFIGNSHIYYGRTVEAKSPSAAYTLSTRTGDTGGFYQLCKQNGIDVDVTNWTFGGHRLGNIFGGEVCDYSECSGYNTVVHEEYLTDKYYDYVVVSPGVGTLQSESFVDDIEYITAFFKEENPDVKVIILGNASAHGVNATDTAYPLITSAYKTLAQADYPIADWGYLVKNIIDGTETVEGATQTYNKNTFIVKDEYHPNMLTGYITTLFTYCTITGEKAEGQPFMYFWNSTTAPADVAAYVEKYYTNGDADTTFPEILKSESDIRGIQKLIDEYIAEKAYLTEY